MFMRENWIKSLEKTNKPLFGDIIWHSFLNKETCKDTMLLS